MKLKCTMFIVALASYLSLSAQFTINGTVKNAETNELLIGAHVLINNQLKAEITNKTGKFVIPCQFEEAALIFHDGWAKVKQNGKWGFIKYSGQKAMPESTTIKY